MSISTKVENGYMVIATGVERLDVVNMKEMKESMMEIVESGHHKIVVDLSSVSFVDSSGLSVIISLFKRLNTLQGEFKLCGLREQPNELLQITQLHKLITIVDSCDAAVQ